MKESNTYGIIPKEEASTILKLIGKTVNTYRTQKQWSMAQLAEKSGTSSSLISDLENNKGKVPSMFTLMSIARALNIPDDSLIKIFMTYNKAPRDIGESAESTLQNLLLGFQLPTSTVNDAMMLLKMISLIGTIHHVKEETMGKDSSLYEQNSVNYLNELVDLYSQYSHKTKK